MADYTNNLNLILPRENENYDVEVANINNRIIDDEINNRVKKIPGKDLSTNDFTNEYKKKIDSMQTLYRFKGTIEKYDDLSIIDTRNVGDTYKCQEDLNNYIWNGFEWINLGNEINYDAVIENINKYQNETKGIIEEYQNETKKLVQEQTAQTVHRYTMTVTEVIENGGVVTMPCYYKPGTDCLDVYLNGQRLICSPDGDKDNGHYLEVEQEESEISNQIQLTEDWGLSQESIDEGRTFEFVVRR